MRSFIGFHTDSFFYFAYISVYSFILFYIVSRLGMGTFNLGSEEGLVLLFIRHIDANHINMAMY